MKHLMTLLALVVAVTAGAQTGLVEFPYNPDADNDDMIGTADLLALLSLYGSEFSEEGTYLSADSTTALYYAGNFDYAMCLHQCSNLSGDWRIPSREQFCQVIHPSESLVTGNAWINQPSSDRQLRQWNREVALEVGYPDDSGMNENWNSESDGHCFCFTHERPKVEYSVVVGQFEANQLEYDLELLSNEKTQDGWYPLGPAVTPDGAWHTQTFWRWAE